MTCIKKNYNISSDWNGTTYCGLTLDWKYNNRTVDLYMPGYIKAALHKYQHPAPARPEHAPHGWNPPIYGAKTQFVSNPTVKLLPLPQPPVRARTDAQTNPSDQRATQLRSVLARVYAFSIQNQITNNVP
jgi:hypothetical protein